MKNIIFITVNFHGGIISPGKLLTILKICRTQQIFDIKFGLRQQLIIEVHKDEAWRLCQSLTHQRIGFTVGKDIHPNIISSYPAEEIFITKTWLSEGSYKDIFDLFQYTPRYKINISDNNQSFTPVITGNINWIASVDHPHFWQLLIRLPKTNKIAEWDQMIYTNDVAKASECIEEMFDKFSLDVYNNGVEKIFKRLNREEFITRPAVSKISLPIFNLPYYEGLNKYGDKYWLGIYRRDELFSVDFLTDLCLLCLETKTGQICSTPWKSIIIKNISPIHREDWNQLLNTYKINVRHAANELNFQVEDNCESGLQTKQYLVNDLQQDDIRSFGICIGIKTRKKSEVFCNILIRRKVLFSLAGIDFFPLYDILCSKDFNPNERTAYIFSANNPRFVLSEQLRRAVSRFYQFRKKDIKATANISVPNKALFKQAVEKTVYRCRHCLTEYIPDPAVANTTVDEKNILEMTPDTFSCELCESSKSALEPVIKSFQLSEIQVN